MAQRNCLDRTVLLTPSNMAEKTRDRLPPTSELIAFECAARLGNVTRAARELQTSPSAVSRYIAGLERRLSVRLFERSGCRYRAELAAVGQQRKLQVHGRRTTHAAPTRKAFQVEEIIDGLW